MTFIIYNEFVHFCALLNVITPISMRGKQNEHNVRKWSGFINDLSNASTSEKVLVFANFNDYHLLFAISGTYYNHGLCYFLLHFESKFTVIQLRIPSKARKG